ncbi:ankyrin repeat domain-containing protein [Xanthomonas sp. NCPPB 1128]|uniref:ankyrin repeat domain-containing protein n=1 Tax=Xanthomonas sp. NCPPB 1128 TaxID=1775876 RepID=UPI00065AB648|nr:ankyrin repeat domain-containing protein [Xanthomonas sp. NCPPB 1128]
MNAHDESFLDSVLAKFRMMAMFEGYQVEGPDSPGMDGDTPLHVAAMDGNFEAVKIFIPFVKNIDVGGGIGNTPLHYAVMWNHPEVVRLLLKHGADINLQNDYGDTPMSLMKGRACFDAILQEQAGRGAH